jgi:hypothetical protein
MFLIFIIGLFISALFTWRGYVPITMLDLIVKKKSILKQPKAQNPIKE